jgi:hypothetical protein
MSHQDETPIAVPQQPLPQEQPVVAMPAAAVEVGAPYRVPEAPPPVMAMPRAPVQQANPILGSSIAVYAVLLWSFVIFGQFTTSWMSGAPLSQGVATLMVFFLTCASWIANLRLSKIVAPPTSIGRSVGRALAIMALAFGLFVSTVVMATVAGAAVRHADFAIAFGLVVLSLVSAIVGPRVISPARPPRSHRARVLVVGLWIAGVLTTLVAAGELLSNG